MGKQSGRLGFGTPSLPSSPTRPASEAGKARAAIFLRRFSTSSLPLQCRRQQPPRARGGPIPPRRRRRRRRRRAPVAAVRVTGAVMCHTMGGASRLQRSTRVARPSTVVAERFRRKLKETKCSDAAISRQTPLPNWVFLERWEIAGNSVKSVKIADFRFSKRAIRLHK